MFNLSLKFDLWCLHIYGFFLRVLTDVKIIKSLRFLTDSLRFDHFLRFITSCLRASYELSPCTYDKIAGLLRVVTSYGQLRAAYEWYTSCLRVVTSSYELVTIVCELVTSYFYYYYDITIINDLCVYKPQSSVILYLKLYKIICHIKENSW